MAVLNRRTGRVYGVWGEIEVGGRGFNTSNRAPSPRRNGRLGGGVTPKRPLYATPEGGDGGPAATHGALVL